MASGYGIDRLGSGSVLVIGDVMLDEYIWGEVNRISPEAPVQIVRVRERSEVLGGAGNVAANLAGLECPVMLVGVRGSDAHGEKIMRLAENSGIEAHLIIAGERPTTTKTRIMAHGQQLLRIDDEEAGSLSSATENNLMSLMKEMIPRCRAVILSDYGKGTLSSARVVQKAVKIGRKCGIPVLVDPKGRDWERYSGATCVTPNAAEFSEAAGLVSQGPDSEFVEAAQNVRKRYDLEWLLITLGARGMCLIGEDKPPLFIGAKAKEVYDVSGAGDTVISTTAAGIASGLPLEDAARLANLAAGIVVGKLGTQPVSIAELRAAAKFDGLGADGGSLGKVAGVDAARILVQSWKATGARIVFTNGCFDLLHPGHIGLLQKARSLGDRLIVGLNADASIRRLKGPSRPILSELDRAALVGALACVDLVVLFEEDTPLALIEALRPDILVKGADYRIEDVVGREVVEGYGGKVVLVPILGGYSTTGVVIKLLAGEAVIGTEVN
ncbi:MAG: D-glycero-beta-D-manno-heptose-7-phosphate kinase [Syntrophobacteraceae bacterium]